MTVFSEIESVDGLIARYVTGSLPEPARVLTAAHLSISTKCHMFAQALHCVGGQLIDDCEPEVIDQRQARLDRIFGASPMQERLANQTDCKVLPPVLRDFIGYDLNSIPWKTKMPGYREFSLGEIDGCEANMLWIKAGRRMPAHTHEGAELTLVVDGAFRDANGRYGRGDVCIADENVDHRPIAENEKACICFVITDAPLRLTGSYRQILTDFIGR